MTDIEKRANNIADAYGYVGLARQHIVEACIEMATEQKAIDIDKACKWLESHFRDIENPDFYSRRNHPTDLESMYHWSVKELVDDFRKAMED